MTPSRVQAIFGLLVVAAAFLFDFGFVTTTDNLQALQENPAAYLASFSRQVYELLRFYLFVLGVLTLALAALNLHLGVSERIQWALFALLLAGSTLFLLGGLWEARRSTPIAVWEPACSVMVLGLIGIFLALALETYMLVVKRVP